MHNSEEEKNCQRRPNSEKITQHIGPFWLREYTGEDTVRTNRKLYVILCKLLGPFLLGEDTGEDKNTQGRTGSTKWLRGGHLCTMV